MEFFWQFCLAASLRKTVKQTSMCFKTYRKIKAGRFSSQDKAFAWKILSQFCDERRHGKRNSKFVNK